MSYRIYVNDYQCLGNNEFPEVLRKALNKQGAKIYPSNDYSFHNFEIKELQPIVEALETYIIEKEEWYIKNNYGSIADFKTILDECKNKNLTYKISNLVECGYMFVTYNFLKAINEDYKTEWDFDKKREIYKIKEGHHVFMSGY